MRSSLRLAVLAGFLSVGAVVAMAQYGEPDTIGKEAKDLLKVRDQQTNEIIFSLKRYRGRVTVFYFWSTRNQESVRQLATMNGLDKKLRSKGVKFVEITPDEDDRLNKAITEKGIERLSQVIKLNGPGAWYLQNLFGAMSHPEVVIVDPSGVLVWRGSPNDRLEERLQEVCESTQPLGGDAKRMSQRLRQAEKLLDQGEVGKAYTFARSIFLVTEEDVSEHGAARTLMDKLEAAAAEAIKKAIEAERAGDKEKAARIVSQIAVRFDDEEQREEKTEDKKEGEKLQVVKDAESEIGRMNGDRTLKQAIKVAMEQCQAELLLERAEEFEDASQYDSALGLYRQITQKYKEAPGAKVAQKNIDRLKDDKKVRVAVDRARDEAEARRWLDIGERFAKVELYDDAREYYERIAKEHPKTEQAKIAKERVGKLPKSARDTAEAGADAKGASVAGKP